MQHIVASLLQLSILVLYLTQLIAGILFATPLTKKGLIKLFRFATFLTEVYMRKYAERYLNAHDSELLAYAMLERISKDTYNIGIRDMVRNYARKQSREDMNKDEMIKVLLHDEAIGLVRRELEALGDSVDLMYGKVLYYQTLMELEIKYAYLYRTFRLSGYRKQFASFIQMMQNQRDGSTRGGDSWDGSDEDLDYSMLFDTRKDYRWDEEHDARVEMWKFRHNI